MSSLPTSDTGTRSAVDTGAVPSPLPRSPSDSWLRIGAQVFLRFPLPGQPGHAYSYPGGTAAPDGPVVESIEDKLELIAAGEAVAIVPAGPRASFRPDLTTIPIDDIGPGHVVLATRAGDRGRLVTAFRKSARECLAGPEQV